MRADDFGKVEPDRVVVLPYASRERDAFGEQDIFVVPYVLP